MVVVVFFKREGGLKDLASSFWTTIGNQQHLPVFFGDSHAFPEHSVADIVVFASDQCIEGALVNDDIELAIFVGHLGGIHDLPNQIWELFAHLLDD